MTFSALAWKQKKKAEKQKKHKSVVSNLKSIGSHSIVIESGFVKDFPSTLPTHKAVNTACFNASYDVPKAPRSLL